MRLGIPVEERGLRSAPSRAQRPPQVACGKVLLTYVVTAPVRKASTDASTSGFHLIPVSRGCPARLELKMLCVTGKDADVRRGLTVARFIAAELVS